MYSQDTKVSKHGMNTLEAVNAGLASHMTPELPFIDILIPDILCIPIGILTIYLRAGARDIYRQV